MPTIAAQAPASCTDSRSADSASASWNTIVPMSTVAVGSSVSMTGGLICNDPDWNINWDRSRPAIPTTANPYGSPDNNVSSTPA